MEIDIKSKDENQILILLEGFDVPFLNAIRRICMTEVPTMAVETVEIYKNDSRLFDEVLVHRLGLVPIKTDLESIVARQECDCEDYCSRCSVTLVLKEKGPKTVYSGDLKSEDPQVGPVHETIPLIKLREGEEVKLEAVTQLGIGLEHAKWQPTTSCAYKHYPQITIDPDLCEACGKCAEECPRGVLKFEEDKNQVLVVDAENCSMCKTCLKDCESEAIQIGVEEGKFIFRIETDGSLPPEKVISTACDVLSEKSDKIITFLEEGGS